METKQKVTIKDLVPVTVMIIIFIFVILTGNHIINNIDFTEIANTLKG